MIEIAVAVVGVFGAVMVALIEKLRRENKADHGMVQSALGRIETKIDGHINDHAKGEL